MVIGVLKEPDFENRVSLLPESIPSLIKKGIEIFVEKNAGAKASCNDDDYAKIGAAIKSKEEIIAAADIILSINLQSVIGYRSSTITIGIYQPLYNAPLMRDWVKQNITVFSIDMLPRTTRKVWMCSVHKPALPVTKLCCLLRIGIPVTSRCS